MRFRERLVREAEASAEILDLDDETGFSRHSRETLAGWQRFTFFEDCARMSDVLFRGPIEPFHGHQIDLRLHDTWRRFHATIADFEVFGDAVAPYRVSAVSVAIRLETSRPHEACDWDVDCELPDARTLASLLSLRCEHDGVAELTEMYRLVCQKLQGVSCSWCGKPFDEDSSVGHLEMGEELVIPATVPKIFIPQCGHAIHTLCFGSQLVPEYGTDLQAVHNGPRGGCRRCGTLYAWTSIDVDPMINAFCKLFGAYVDKRAGEMRANGLSPSVAINIAEVCKNFSQELNGLVSPSSAWILLTRRHCFSDPEIVDAIGAGVLSLLSPSEVEVDAGTPPELPAEVCQFPSVVGPEDLSDEDLNDEDRGEFDYDPGGGADDRRHKEERHVTEIFMPVPLSSLEFEPSSPMAPLPGDPCACALSPLVDVDSLDSPT